MNARLFLFVILMTCSLLSGAAFAKGEKISIAVAQFTNETVHQGGYARWWNSPSVGWELSGMLSNELAATGAFDVVERNQLDAVLSEQDLAASGRIDPDTAAPTGAVTGALYLVLGTVTAYEEGTSGTDGGIGYKGFKIGGGISKAYIAVDIRVLNSRTGKLDYVRTIEGTSSGGGVSLGAYRGGFGGSLETYKNTPAGKAIRAALIHISDYLECAMVDQGKCLEEYDQADDQRREKTKSAIKLD